MTASLDGADEHLVQARRNQRQRHLREGRVQNPEVVLRGHLLVGEDLGQLIEDIDQRIEELAMLIGRAQIALLAGLLHPFVQPLANVQAVQKGERCSE